MEEYLSEKEQWEQVTRWLRENGLWIIAGIVVGAAGLGGWHWYQGHVDSVGEAASTKYNDLVQDFAKSDRTSGFVALGELERDFPNSPYVDQGKLMAARIYVDDGALDKAASELQSVVEHTNDADLALIARLRLARVQISQKKPDAALATLNGLKAGAFEPQMHEIAGDAYYAKGDKANALKEYTSAKLTDVVAQSLNSAELELKIDDLTAENPQAVARAATPPGANAAAK